MAARERWRQTDSTLKIPVPADPPQMLTIVQSYRHLGTMTAASAETYGNAALE